MAKSDGASAPTGQERSLFLLLRESGDALEAASPPFDASAGAAQLREAAWAHGLLRPDDTLDKDLAVTAANLEEEAPPFDVDAGAARLKDAAHARGLLSGSALEASRKAASSRSDLRVHDSVALEEIELYADVLSAVAATDRPLTAEELDEVLGVREVAGAAVPRRGEKSPSSPASRPRHQSIGSGGDATEPAAGWQRREGVSSQDVEIGVGQHE
jgi:hypothetical protein